MLLLGGAAFMLFFAHSAFAQSKNTDITLLDGKSQPDELFDSNITNQPLRITMDKSEVIHLNKPAGSVIIGNSAHVGVLVEDANTIILVPREPGASFLTIMAADKSLIMQRHVIVASSKKHYIRIRQSCATAKRKDCVPIKTYYCPDMCYEINNPKDSNGASSSSKASSSDDNIIIGGTGGK